MVVEGIYVNHLTVSRNDFRKLIADEERTESRKSPNSLEKYWPRPALGILNIPKMKLNRWLDLEKAAQDWRQDSIQMKQELEAKQKSAKTNLDAEDKGLQQLGVTLAGIVKSGIPSKETCY